MAKGESQALNTALLRLNGRAWGIAFGLVLGIGLFFATNILVLRGGEDVGRHLSLLAVFFPGYSVTFVGSLICFVYAFVVGYGLGRFIGEFYPVLEQTPKHQFGVHQVPGAPERDEPHAQGAF